jgi:hypothetical protein
MDKLRSFVAIVGLALASASPTACGTQDECADGACPAAIDPSDAPPVRTCQRACGTLLGICDVTSEDDPAVKVDLSGCVSDCRDGALSVAEADCLAATACGASYDQCLVR